MLHQSEAVNILKMKLQQMKGKLCEGGGADKSGRSNIIFSTFPPPPPHAHFNLFRSATAVTEILESL